MARPNGSTKLSSRGRDLCSAASIMHSLSISAQRGPRPCSGRDVASGALLRALHKLALPAHRARTLYLGIRPDGKAVSASSRPLRMLLLGGRGLRPRIVRGGRCPFVGGRRGCGGGGAAEVDATGPFARPAADATTGRFRSSSWQGQPVSSEQYLRARDRRIPDKHA